MSTVSVRYSVHGVDAAIAFYVDHLAFAELIHPDPAFAMLTNGDLRLVLVSPVPAGHRGGGSRPMPDGTRQQPGGWNRFMIEVADLAGTVDRLNAAGAHFRNEIVTGIGTRQILLEDPSGNVVELFEPVRPEARLTPSPEAAASPHPVGAVGWLASFRRGSPAPRYWPQGGGGHLDAVVLRRSRRSVEAGAGSPWVRAGGRSCRGCRQRPSR